MYRYFLAVFLLGFIGCQKSDEFTVARVGHYSLSEESLMKSAVPEESLDRWVELTLLALEAEKRHLDDNITFREEVEKIRIGLLANILLEGEFAKVTQPDAKEIEDYYQANIENFRRHRKEVEFVTISGLDNSLLKEVRRSLLRGAKIEDIATDYPGFQIERSVILDPASMPHPLDKLKSAVRNDVIGPEFIGKRQYLFKIIAVHEEGSIKSLESARDNVIDQILEDKKYRRRELLLKELKDKYNPQINYKRSQAAGVISGDME